MPICANLFMVAFSHDMAITAPCNSCHSCHSILCLGAEAHCPRQHGANQHGCAQGLRVALLGLGPVSHRHGEIPDHWAPKDAPTGFGNCSPDKRRTSNVPKRHSSFGILSVYRYTPTFTQKEDIEDIPVN